MFYSLNTMILLTLSFILFGTISYSSAISITEPATFRCWTLNDGHYSPPNVKCPGFYYLCQQSETFRVNCPANTPVWSQDDNKCVTQITSQCGHPVREKRGDDCSDAEQTFADSLNKALKDVVIPGNITCLQRFYTCSTSGTLADIISAAATGKCEKEIEKCLVALNDAFVADQIAAADVYATCYGGPKGGIDCENYAKNLLQMLLDAKNDEALWIDAANDYSKCYGS